MASPESAFAFMTDEDLSAGSGSTPTGGGTLEPERSTKSEISRLDRALNLWFPDRELVAEDYDLSHLRKRVRYFGWLGFALAMTFIGCAAGLVVIFFAVLDIVTNMNSASMEVATTQLKVVAPAAVAVTFGMVASLMLLARVSQPSKRTDEGGIEFPSLIADLLKEFTNWVKKKASGGGSE